MLEITPLEWPFGWKRSTVRKVGRFQNGGGIFHPKTVLTYRDAIDRVAEQLDFLGVHVKANTTIVTCNRGRALQDDPGAAVYWISAAGRREVMAMDMYTGAAQNFAAIAATLDAMRTIERHGGAAVLERAFSGFEALPAPAAFDPWKVLEMHQPANGASHRLIVDAVNLRFRNLAKTRHPDSGGSAEQFRELVKARDAALALWGVTN